MVHSYDRDEAAKWLVYLRIQASGNLLQLSQFLVMLFVYVHSMTCLTMIVSWVWLSGDGEESPHEVLRWLDIDDTERADTSQFVFFYFHCSLWVWSNVSGWGGNWSPHSFITSGNLPVGPLKDLNRMLQSERLDIQRGDSAPSNRSSCELWTREKLRSNSAACLLTHGTKSAQGGRI